MAGGQSRRRGYVLRTRLARGFDRHRRVTLSSVYGPSVSRAPRGVESSGRSTSASLHDGLARGQPPRALWGHRRRRALDQVESVEAFADAFAAHADEHLADEDLQPVTRVDAVVAGAELTLDLCEELRRLAPFGLGNPGVTLLLPACELRELGAVGEGKHLRFRVNERGRDAGSAIAFGIGKQMDRYRREGRYDVVFRSGEPLDARSRPARRQRS